jgi:hypothetical protein
MVVAGADITTGITATGADISVSQTANLVFLERLTAKAAMAPVYLGCCGLQSMCHTQPVPPIIR